jgi:rhamnogalacturonyl hydrolase YesR
MNSVTLCKIVPVVFLGLTLVASASTNDAASVLSTLHAVADWQLAHPSRHRLTDWTQGAGFVGFMALSTLPGGKKYEDAMIKVGAETHWKLGPRCRNNADDDCIGQMYLDLYARAENPDMIAETRQVMDEFCASRNPEGGKKLSANSKLQWTWCDALFMAPPVFAKLYAITGDVKYYDTLMSEYKRATDLLYDPGEHLFFRDQTYFNKREANGRKVFWGRGNGWVFGGLANILSSLPKDAPGRSYFYFAALFQEMAAKVITLQQPDGLWRASLLDPASYPLKETSGSGFFCFGLAWGINNGLLDRVATLPAVDKAWDGLVACVNPEGKLTHVQPVGANPKKFDPQATEIYGVGAFLLAGTEVYRLRQTPVPAMAGVTMVTVENPLPLARRAETIEVPWTAGSATVLEEGTPVSSQIFEGKLLFQSDFAPGQLKTFTVSRADGFSFPIRAYGRHVPERMDDYAWENDRIAFRIYGPTLMEKPPRGEGLVSSGIDVWVKRTRNLVIDNWYKSRAYHKDRGEGLDYYHVGGGRGCGGIGILTDGTLNVSRNWATQKTLAVGPVRTVAEISYEPWACGNGVTVAETRRIILDAGANLNRFESRFTITGTNSVTVAVGLNVSKEGKHNGSLAGGAAQGFFANWEPEQKANGATATAILVTAGPTGEIRDGSHVFLTAPARSQDPFVWYAGAGWSKSGDFADAAEWTASVEQVSARLKAPLKITYR